MQLRSPENTGKIRHTYKQITFNNCQFNIYKLPVYHKFGTFERKDAGQKDAGHVKSGYMHLSLSHSLSLSLSLSLLLLFPTHARGLFACKFLCRAGKKASDAAASRNHNLRVTKRRLKTMLTAC